jgi:hypothetical protein
MERIPLTGPDVALASFPMSFPNGIGVDLEAFLAIAIKKERQIHISFLGRGECDSKHRWRPILFDLPLAVSDSISPQ